ncbi:MAG TPA: hypothetical protein VGQ86_03545 [Candidatus Limnocylindria bacterium]|jgi:hypothetical protein|nr:hypothetical protein [Candidatus Limnocylindria bacterium]
MKNATWPKAFAYIGLTIMGLAFAYYATAMATGGITAKIIGRDPFGDMITLGSIALMLGIAMAAVFAFLAITQVRALSRRT